MKRDRDTQIDKIHIIDARQAPTDILFCCTLIQMFGFLFGIENACPKHLTCPSLLFVLIPSQAGLCLSRFHLQISLTVKVKSHSFFQEESADGEKKILNIKSFLSFFFFYINFLRG